MEIEEVILFFNKHNLKGLTYCVYGYFKHKNEIARLKSRIKNLGGKISETISADAIMILEEIQIREVEKMFQRYKEFTKAFIFENKKVTMVRRKASSVPTKDETANSAKKYENEIRRDITGYIMKAKENNLRIIKLKDIHEIIAGMENRMLREHYKLGLSKDIDILSTISVITQKELKKKIHYHSFQVIRDSRSGKKYYDYLKYYKEAPIRFSSFMTIEEKKQIDNYMKKQTTNDSTVLTIKQETPEDQEPPMPHKGTKFCNLCSVRFDDYLAHIYSEPHLMLKAKHATKYLQIEKTFERVRKFWSDKEKVKTSINKNNQIIKKDYDNEISVQDENQTRFIDLRDDEISIKPDETLKTPLTIISPASTLYETANKSKSELLNKKRKRTDTSLDNSQVQEQSQFRPAKLLRSKINQIILDDPSMKSFIDFHKNSDKFLTAESKFKRSSKPEK